MPLAHELGQDYCEVCLDFRVQRSCELDLRVRFAGGGSLRLAGVTLQRLD